MKCIRCTNVAVFITPTYCKKHFLQYVEKKADATIKKYQLITSQDKVVVGVSGGKDSLTVLYLLRKYAKNLIAICIDEGIEGYRPITIEDMKQFCEKYGIQYFLVSFENEMGMPLDKMKALLKENPCTICGAFRRYLLNKKAREHGATKLVTGHNLDDEAQAIVMNLLRHQTELLPRLGPITGAITDAKFIPRVKPLYFLTEKEIAAYAYLQNFGVNYVECPNALHAYRAVVGNMMCELELQFPGTKQRIIKQFVHALPMIRKKIKQKHSVKYCQNCQEPCVGMFCKACQLLEKLQQSRK